MADTTLCSRCGDKLPDGPARVLLERPFCQPCTELPGVDFLEETRQRYLGRRDGYVWLMGGVWLLKSSAEIVYMGVVLTSSPGPFGGLQPVLSIMAILAVGAALSLATLALWRPARVVWIVFILLIPLLFAMALGPGAGDVKGSVISSAISLVVAIGAWRSPRNHLAFGMDVSEDGLKDVYANFIDNRPAHYGSALGVLSLIPPLGLLGVPGLILSINGLRKVAPEAWPPVGLRGRAIAGIVSSVLGMIITVVATLLLFSGRPS